MHTFIENEVMYPEARALLPELEDDVLESYEEHHVAALLCVELFGMPADAEHFGAKTSVLIVRAGQFVAVTSDSARQVRAGDSGLVLIAVCAART